MARAVFNSRQKAEGHTPRGQRPRRDPVVRGVGTRRLHRCPCPCGSSLRRAGCWCWCRVLVLVLVLVLVQRAACCVLVQACRRAGARLAEGKGAERGAEHAGALREGLDGADVLAAEEVGEGLRESARSGFQAPFPPGVTHGPLLTAHRVIRA